MKLKADEPPAMSSFRFLLPFIVFYSQSLFGSCFEETKIVNSNNPEYFMSCHQDFKFFEYHITELFENSSFSSSIELRIGDKRAACRINGSLDGEACFLTIENSLETESKILRFSNETQEWNNDAYKWSYDIPGIELGEVTCAIGVTSENMVDIFLSKNNYTGLINCLINFNDYLLLDNRELNLKLRQE